MHTDLVIAGRIECHRLMSSSVSINTAVRA